MNMFIITLSHQLKLLEDELEVKLIERTTKKFQITGAGELLQYQAEQILELVKTTVKELENYNNESQGRLSIGTVPSSGAVFLPELLSTFHEKYPGLNFQIREGDTYKIIEMLTRGIIDIGIVRTPFNSEIFESICLDDVRSVLSWADPGMGVGIIPKPAIGLISSLNLKYIEID
jgi:DNA-binding transcriptional LysR family regulator